MDKREEVIKFAALQAASEAFGSRLPDNWEEMTGYEQDDWLDYNKMDAFEHLSNDEYYTLVDCHADTVLRFLGEYTMKYTTMRGILDVK